MYRNVSVGLVLALTYFPPSVSIPITMFILFQQPVAAAIPFLFKNNIVLPAIGPFDVPLENKIHGDKRVAEVF